MAIPFSLAQNEGMKPFVLIPSLLVVNAALASEPSVRIRLIDEVHLDAEARGTLVSKSVEILDAAGVSSTWLECPDKPVPEMPAGCLESLAGNELIIRILGRGMRGNDHGLGSSVAGPEGGVYGLIYYPNIEKTARIVEIPVTVMLALATVHEIGHLILGSHSHWPAGVMQARWNRKAVSEMIQLNLFFNQSQSRTMRQRLLARTSQK